MDKHIEETRSIYYESSQDSHSSDSDWSYPKDSQDFSDSSQEMTSDEEDSNARAKSI